MSPPSSSEMDFLDHFNAESPPPSVEQQLPQTPGRDIALNPLPTFPTTPHAHGSAARAAFDDDQEPTSNARYQRKDYDEYLKHDLQNNRVFMHAEKFMELVFRTPANWAEDPSCRDVLTFITAHDDFKKALKDFLQSAKGPGTEHRLYPWIVALYAAVLKLLDQCDPLPDNHDRKTLKLAFSINDPTELVGGVMKRLSPDIKSLFDSFTVHDKALSFSNLVHVVEVKDTNVALCRGDNDARILHQGMDPLQKPRGRQAKQASTPNSGQASSAASGGTKTGKAGSVSRKRIRTEDDEEGSNSGRKINRQSDEAFSVSRNAQSSEDPKTQVDPQTQCARYAMEHLSNAVLRSHSILTLFDKDRLQFEYFDRSVIAVSTAVDLSTEDGQTLFILMVYGLRRLSPEDLGLRNVVQDSLKFCTDYESASKYLVEDGCRDWRRLFYDRKITIENVEYILKDIVFRQPGLIGRTTCVVVAQRGSDNKRFAVKISCPTTSRSPEMQLIQNARSYANSDKKHAWVLHHLPNMIASQDIDIDENSVQGRMRDFLNTAEYADDKRYYYENRCLRICVSEELLPITRLTSQREVAQVFFDILQTHKWMYDVPRILHRDLSMSNIMVREDEEGNVYGVPNDLDLASLLSELESESGNTSLRRTGTPPFMAFDLQNPHDSHVRHLYRHDLESLFYVLLMLVCRHDIVDTYPWPSQTLRENLPFAEWFDWNKSWAELQAAKAKFFHETEITVIKSWIAPSFQDFEDWVVSLWSELGKGFRKRRDAKAPVPVFALNPKLSAAINAGRFAGPIVQEAPTVDDETLGGQITYWTFLKYMIDLKGVDLEYRCPQLGV